MSMTVGQVLHLLDELAPATLAEPWDNVGLIVGSPAQQVDTLLVTLDVSREALTQAAELGTQLIISHHPLLFHPRQNLRETDAEGALLCGLVRGGLSLIAAHTNWDCVAGGSNDALCQALGLKAPTDPGLYRMVSLDVSLDIRAFARLAEAALGAVARVYPSQGPITRVLVCGGAGGEAVPSALKCGAHLMVTGELKHHELCELLHAGVGVIELGHAESEMPGVYALAKGLQNRMDALQCSIRVCAHALRRRV